jgi:nucleoside-diphosphate-sugar epimerase
VVVTGASGFLGAQLAVLLERRGHTVIGVDRLPRPTAAPDSTADHSGPGRVVTPRWRHLQADLAEPAAEDLLRSCLKGADAIVHLAARPGVRSAEPHIAALRHRDIVLATDHVLAATEHDVHLVVASSSSVYGSARMVDGGLRPSHEDDRLAPRGGYARAKLIMERRTAQWAAAGGRVTVVRPFTVVGEGQRWEMALSTWIRQALAGQPLTVLGSLDRRRDLTDVRRVVRALAALLDKGLTGTYNLGAGRPRTLAEMVAAVARATGTNLRIDLRPGSTEEVADTFADTERVRTRLGHHLATDLDEIVDRQLAWAIRRPPATRTPEPASAA